MSINCVKLETVNLKKHPVLNENWVQRQIENDPALLGLGELEVLDRQRRQSSGGVLDLLLKSPDTSQRYEVEIQLGAVDESHIIRTIEYWDIERKKYPDTKHSAVIIAEEITGRFLNVISLFNGAIPLIALKMTAYQVGDDVALTFVRVLDELTLGAVDDDEPTAEPVDHDFWLRRSSDKSLKILGELMAVVQQAEPRATLSYMRHYIGLRVDGFAKNFVSFRPLRNSVTMKIKLTKTAERDAAIEETELEALSYEAPWRQYRIRIDSPLTEKQKVTLLELICEARDEMG
jgi:hypothetical protein